MAEIERDDVITATSDVITPVQKDASTGNEAGEPSTPMTEWLSLPLSERKARDRSLERYRHWQVSQ